jgi:hypothetical protein
MVELQQTTVPTPCEISRPFALLMETFLSLLSHLQLLVLSQVAQSAVQEQLL